MFNRDTFPDFCIETRATKDEDGYGRVRLKTGGKEGAHKLAYRIFVGAVPQGYVVMHTCDNPACCNPKHLRIGTQKENVQDALLKGRRPQNPDTVSKIKAEDAISILTIESNISSRKLAKKYGVTRHAIELIRSGKSQPEVYQALSEFGGDK